MHSWHGRETARTAILETAIRSSRTWLSDIYTHTHAHMEQRYKRKRNVVPWAQHGFVTSKQPPPPPPPPPPYQQNTHSNLVFLKSDVLGVAVVRSSSCFQQGPRRGEVGAAVEKVHVRGGVVPELGGREEATVDPFRLQLNICEVWAGMQVNRRTAETRERACSRLGCLCRQIIGHAMPGGQRAMVSQERLPTTNRSVLFNQRWLRTVLQAHRPHLTILID